MALDSCSIPTDQLPVIRVDSGSASGSESYFASGQSTVDIGTDYLPMCVTRDRGQYMELHNTNTSLVVGRSGPFDSVRTALPETTTWNTAVYSTLNRELSGVYKCNTDARISASLWKITIIGKSARA